MDAIIRISSFGDNEINGVYHYSGLSSGYQFWKKNHNTYLIYKPKWMPWSNK